MTNTPQDTHHICPLPAESQMAGKNVMLDPAEWSEAINMFCGETSRPLSLALNGAGCHRSRIHTECYPLPH